MCPNLTSAPSVPGVNDNGELDCRRSCLSHAKISENADKQKEYADANQKGAFFKVMNIIKIYLSFILIRANPVFNLT